MTSQSNSQSSAPALPSWKTGVLLNILLIAVLVPVVNIGMFKFVVAPYIRSEIAESKGGGRETLIVSDGGDLAYAETFQNVVTNVSGTMGRRYLQVSFTIRSANPELESFVGRQRDRLQAEAADQFSQLDMASLEQREIRKLMQDRIKLGFNHILGDSMVEEVNFTQFVVQ